MDDPTLQSEPAVEPVVAVQHQRQMLLEFGVRKSGEETEVPEIHAENRDVSSGDGSARSEQRPVPSQYDQEIDRIRIEVHDLGPFGQPNP